MLELKGIVKDYITGNETVHALRGIDIAFRENEFVAVLGHSGCGKTTLLNIIGGLDRYTSGVLKINGRSTEEFSDRDWDAYRNHSVGFVFQNYNLIPHQTVLKNVELALTLTGVKRAERKKRAKEALAQVGLEDQINKKPNQLSGGQMQRVAIARALVNDPDILLADEPTGALDSETSVQVMDILKKISENKLIIMVTHNPELADTYANRIVRIVDGTVVEDSRPFAAEDVQPKELPQKKVKKPSMSFLTACGLSMTNLLTKKTRTILTAFAGSIGIIGIALILSMSNGIQNYIDDVQEETLSNYPLSIESETVDMSDMITQMMGDNAEENGGVKHDKDKVYFSTVMYDLINSMTSVEVNKNNLKDFRKFLDGDQEVQTHSSAIQYNYGRKFDIYTKDADGKIVKADVMTLLQDTMKTMYGADFSSYFSNFGQMYENYDVWEELLTDIDSGDLSSIYEKQYDLLYGKWPENKDELVLIVDQNNEISDMVMYALGLRSSAEMADAMDAAMNMEQIDISENGWEYSEICDRQLKMILPADYYQYEEATGNYVNLSETDTGLSYLYGNQEIGLPLKIVGIVRMDQDAMSNRTTGAIGYTKALTDYALEQVEKQEIVKKQLADEKTDVISGLPFKDPDAPEPSAEEKKAAVEAYAEKLDISEKADLYRYIMTVPDEAYVNGIVEQQIAGLDRATIEEQVKQLYAQDMGVDAATVESYIAEMDDETLFENVRESIRQQVKAQYAEQVNAQLVTMQDIALAGAYDAATWADWQYGEIYDNYMPSQVSDSTYEDNLELLGYMRKDTPESILIYVSSFEDKEIINDAIARYNQKAAEEDKIDYTDYIQLLMSSITTIIDAISYVLIAFVAVSLVVSSIMIGIITYISVLERTKEIGILRAIGASKKDISRVFNAETILIGLVSGVFGIGLTLLLILSINYIIHRLTDIYTINAALPAAGGVILVVISILLTFVAGLIPSRIAARKDPVEALRTE